jgi:hypothetical protein
MSPGTEKSWSDSVGTNGPLSVVALRYTIDVPDVVHELLVAELALEKLGARSISAVEAEQMLRNPHVTVRNPHGGDGLDTRRLMIGLTDGGRFLTLVIERTDDQTTWLVVTGWSSTAVERRILRG